MVTKNRIVVYVVFEFLLLLSYILNLRFCNVKKKQALIKWNLLYLYLIQTDVICFYKNLNRLRCICIRVLSQPSFEF